MVTRDEIEVTLKVRMFVHTGGLFEEQGHGMVATKPEDWAPGSDMGFTLPSPEEIARRELPGLILRPPKKLSFWEWLRGDYNDEVARVIEVLKVSKPLSSAYISGK